MALETFSGRYEASCPTGLERFLEDEIRQTGGEPQARRKGRIAFTADKAAVYRLCLWTRLAARVIQPVAQWPAGDAEALYEAARALDWSAWLTPRTGFMLTLGAVTRPALGHSRYALLKVKDALVDRVRADCGERPSVARDHPDWVFALDLQDDTARLSLDLCGEPLHRRGYREHSGAAPLRENLAAGLLHYAGWAEAGGGTLVDPMCGAGTILIEAAAMALELAPGLNRDAFGFLQWSNHEPRLWASINDEARARHEAALAGEPPRLRGFDADPAAIEATRANARAAGLEHCILAKEKALGALRASDIEAKGRAGEAPGYLVSNPPYGERMEDTPQIGPLYRCLARRLGTELPGWQACVLTAEAAPGEALGLGKRKGVRLFNGPVACQIRQGELRASDQAPPGPALELRDETEAELAAPELANRLRKNFKTLKKWAERQGLSCFRIYDADLPQYNAAVDVYENHLYVQEYAPPKSVDPASAEARRRVLKDTLRQVLRLNGKRLHMKTRAPQKGARQYQKMASSGRFTEVREDGARLLVNFTDYLDTGLFLDHRITRGWIRDWAKNARFLNLFSYTAAATVYAALGGARASVSVDLSPVYSDWAKANLALNGFSGGRHELVQADVMSWLETNRRTFDLIFADPPTFSNSKRLKRDFRVQQDHAALIRSLMRRLAPEGVLIFSNNYRRFQLDEAALADYRIEEVTRRTLDKDFERSRAHRCWLIRHELSSD